MRTARSYHAQPAPYPGYETKPARVCAGSRSGPAVAPKFGIIHRSTSVLWTFQVENEARQHLTGWIETDL
jgi:hypothetical protein